MTIGALVLFITVFALITGFIIVYAFRHRSLNGSKELIFILAAEIIYTLPYVFQLLSSDQAQALAWYNLSILGANLMGPAWVYFALAWSDLDTRFSTARKRTLRFGLLIPTLLVCIASWTNSYHGLYGSVTAFFRQGILGILEWDFGYFYWIGFFSSYILAGSGIFLIVRNAIRRLRLFLYQSLLVILGALVPVISHFIFISSPGLLNGFDLTPFMFLVTAIFWSVAIFFFRFLTVIPIAHQNVFRNASIGMIILDYRKQVLDINDNALKILNLPLGKVINRELPEQVTQMLEFEANDGDETLQSVRFPNGSNAKVVEIRVKPLGDSKQKVLLGYLLQMTDITERVFWEQTLQESEERLSLAQKIAGFGTWELDLATKVIWGSASAFQIQGIEQESPYVPLDVIQHTIVDEDRERLDGALLTLSAGLRDFDEEYQIIRPNDKQRRTVHSVANRVLDSDGKPVKILGVVQDVTERKRIEEALKSSEEKYRLIAENSGDVIWVLDLESMKFTYVSPSVYQLRGYTPEEVMAQPMSEALTPESALYVQQKLTENLAHFLEGRPVISIDQIAQPHKDGHIVWTETSTHYMRDEETGKLTIHGVSRDITTRRQTEAELQKKTEELENFFTLTPDLLTIATMEGYFLRTNPSWTKLLGYTEEELTRGKFFEFIHPEDLQPTLDRMADLAAQQKVFNFTNRYRCKDGTYKVIEWHSQPSGSLIYAAARDVTERKQLEDQLIYQSTHDVLTGLYNRHYYETEITRLQKSRQFPVSILVMDVNELKKVNDALGHDAGDRLLQCAAQGLMAAFRPEDLVARIGGDEFAVVLPRTRLDAAQLAAARVHENIARRNQECAEEFSISVAIGTACGEPGENLSDVFKKADQAMYREKQKRVKIR